MNQRGVTRHDQSMHDGNRHDAIQSAGQMDQGFGQGAAPASHASESAGMDGEPQSMSEDVIMAFLEGAESRLNFHQAELIRLACQGFTKRRIAKAQYILDRALQFADTRPATLPVDDAFNGYIMDFIEEADNLTYHEAEFLRRVDRGCNREDLN